MADLKNRLQGLRKQKGISQQRLADVIGVNKQTISQYERGVRKPDIETLGLLCDYFNVSADYMLGKVDVTMRYVSEEELSLLERKPALLPHERQLLAAYRSLNHIGRSEALKRIEELTQIDNYTKDTESLTG